MYIGVAVDPSNARAAFADVGLGDEGELPAAFSHLQTHSLKSLLESGRFNDRPWHHPLLWQLGEDGTLGLADESAVFDARIREAEQRQTPIPQRQERDPERDGDVEQPSRPEFPMPRAAQANRQPFSSL